MKKIISIALVLIISVVMFSGCSTSDSDTQSNDTQTNETNTTESTDTESETIVEDTMVNNDQLIVYFVPSREPEEIISATEPLKELLKTELEKLGYGFDEIKIEVGTTYEAVGEAMGAGTADVGFIPGGTYVLYDDGADVILTATRAGLSKDSPNPSDWNDGLSTEGTDVQVTYYRGLIIAGPSEKGQALLEKVNKGEEITHEDMEGLNWGVRSSSSSSGYIYPTIWLQDHYGLSLTELPNVVQTDSYGSTMAYLASGQIDVGTIYADARRDYVDKWQADYGRGSSIWEETGVIGVTDPIYNDTISVSKTSEIMDEGLKTALQTAFMNIAETDEGKEVISIYSHEGYQIANDSDYDNERKAQEIIKSFE